MSNRSDRLTYTAAQTARIVFYGAHYLAARLAARDACAEMEPLRGRVPPLRELLQSMRSLFRRDWQNVEAGLYPMPVDIKRDVLRAGASLKFWSDIPQVTRRQKERGHSEVRAQGRGLPRYYRQNFHFQTDGYLSDRSAQLYDFQVDTLFAGTADAMRRQVFVPLARHLASCRAADPAVLDIGAGTGRFVSFVNSVRPDWNLIALDLSEPYLARAKDECAKDAQTQFVAAAAEAMPLPDASMDAVVSIYVFHELPPKIRQQAAREIGRVLKPGGIFVLGDTIQYGDVPGFDGLIEAFPRLLHEPYYAGFAKSDLAGLFAPHGLTFVSRELAYLTKVTTFRRDAPKRRRRNA